MYYDGNLGGAMTAFHANVGDFDAPVGRGPYTFIGGGSDGRGQRVKNNVASARNIDTTAKAIVFYNENYSGPSDIVNPSSWRNLVNTWNNNASLDWF